MALDKRSFLWGFSAGFTLAIPLIVGSSMGIHPNCGIVGPEAPESGGKDPESPGPIVLPVNADATAQDESPASSGSDATGD